MNANAACNVGLIGFGTIGTGAAKILLGDAERVAERAGVPVRLAAIADVDLERDRGVDVSGVRLTRDAGDLLADPTIDIVVELVGGTTIARTFVETALRHGKHVVTANKALLAAHGAELFTVAAAAERYIGLEGAVAGGIPLIQTLDGALAATYPREIYGIINGTCNYILTGMTEGRGDFAAVLAEAQAKGYAEADPTLDVEGEDARQKLAIFATLCFGSRVPVESIHVEGIARVTPQDLAHAAELGYAVKLLAVAKDRGDAVEARVHPTLVPREHLLAAVNGVYNAVCLVSPGMGTTLLYGRGAGEAPTGQAVVSDIIQIARRRGAPYRRGLDAAFARDDKPTAAMETVETAYYLRLAVVDRPGVVGQVASILGRHGISIASLMQLERWEVGDVVPIVLMTHVAVEGAMQQARQEIDALESVRAPALVLRVERPA